MEARLYVIILIFFLIGGCFMFLANKNKEQQFQKKNWLKYGVYLVIVNILFLSILINPFIFRCIGIVVVILAYGEIILAILKSKHFKAGAVIILVFSILVYGFYCFLTLSKPYLFYVLFMTTVFDSFSQLSGQLLGKRLLAPKISPNKTYGGLYGGIIFGLFTSILIQDLLLLDILNTILLALGLLFFAFIGDLLASLSKRLLLIKDFSNLIPGHGGMLDRFDSLIAAGAFMYVAHLFL